MIEILKLASIRQFVDSHFPKEIYFDVMERIQLPSPDGDYSGYDAIVTVRSKEEKTAIQNLFNNVENAKVAVILL